MDLSPFLNAYRCVWEKKRLLIAFAALYLLGALLGALFIRTPSVYEYHLGSCERFMARICFSDRSVIVIFFERAGIAALLLALMLLAGIHAAALILPPALLLYRAYTLGGSTVIFFTVYRVTGVLVFLVLYLPVRLLTDALLVAATVLSCERARSFGFSRGEFAEIARDFAALLAAAVGVCLYEGILLFALFHPIGGM